MMDSVIIYGVGTRGKRMFFQLRDVIERLFLAVTDNKSELYPDFLGNHIYSLVELTKLRSEAVVIVASAGKSQKEMADYAEKNGFNSILCPIIPEEYERLKGTKYFDLKKEILEWYAIRKNRWIDIDNPRNFDEKIQWLKLHDSTSIKTDMADKYKARTYVSSIIGEKYLVPLLGAWDNYDEIDFSQLPEKFVLKCNHGSGMNEIVESKDSINHNLLRQRFNEWLSIDYAIACGFEMHYKDIERKIIAEEYLSSDDNEDLKDYKVHCFGGKAKMIQVDIGRYTDHKRNLYTTNWEYMPYSICYPTDPNIIIQKPHCLEEILQLAEKLAVGFIYVRVDFYISNGKVYFGEMTFTHGSGDEEITPAEFGNTMGDWIVLP